MASRVRAHHTQKKGRSLRPRDPPSQPQKDIYLKKYAETLIHCEARYSSSITNKQYRRLLETDADFAAKIHEIHSELPDRAEEVLAKKAIIEEDRDLLRTFLTAFKPERYGNKNQIDLNVHNIEKLSMEEIEEQIAAWHKKHR